MEGNRGGRINVKKQVLSSVGHIFLFACRFRRRPFSLSTFFFLLFFFFILLLAPSFLNAPLLLSLASKRKRRPERLPGVLEELDTQNARRQAECVLTFFFPSFFDACSLFDVARRRRWWRASFSLFNPDPPRRRVTRQNSHCGGFFSSSSPRARSNHTNKTKTNQKQKSASA